MNDVISQLIALQRLDLQLDTIDQEILQEQEAIDLQSTLLAQRESNIEDLQEQIYAMEQERRTLELESEEEMAHVKSRQSKMMQVQTGREQTALLKEIEDGKRGIKEKEEKLVALMEATEDLTNQISHQKELLAAETKKLEEETAKAKAAIEAITQTKEDHNSKRQQQAKEVDKKLLNKYNLLRERRKGLAVANVLQGVCQGCFMSIPPQQYNLLLRGDRHLDCPVCQRIIYHLAPADEQK